jgi:DNA-binding phage protein
VGFERLAEATGKPVKSLHRMLSAAGNPSMDNLAVIFGAVRRELGVGIRVKTIKAA